MNVRAFTTGRVRAAMSALPNVVLHSFSCSCAGRRLLGFPDHSVACDSPNAVEITRDDWLLLGRPRTLEDYQLAQSLKTQLTEAFA